MKKYLLSVIFCLCGGIVFAQSSGSANRIEYLEQYYVLAIEEMNRSGIPASITLAQAVLESGDGRSTLATQANNHFGIKCHDDWMGRSVRHDDDARNECFRRYRSVEDSYRDHTDFLTTRQRYSFLFELDPMDYKSWARGLKQAGYATSPDYANALIRIIEDYDLQQYDLLALNYPQNLPARTRLASGTLATGRQILENNRVKYVIARADDTFGSLTQELDKMAWELPRYNDFSHDGNLEEGQVVYIQPKRNKARAGIRTHTVREGETMYEISQLYAIKLERLYKLNRMADGAEPVSGAVLQLRKALKGSQVPVTVKEPLPTQQEPGEAPEEEGELIFDLDL